ncbi:molybdenum cofactor guanylyltransferase [Clostridium estertheticum]|uniref:Probable molybdenum cofactor guanylyltransferase n=1 Tax=Clostridium estertheticum TaxID=238834 RepID=A0AA47EFZ5_9CLOT|nr:molybdenum cofactor guanylyltransferase [Clostridium estertheticum]MBU3156545.1 molybdenum cofactor guanylyltransferase [Clostridium estertheticum]WAG59306.1 molybdenum cofactor guanylyltransferase [Clostridium estertheticum]
MDTTKIAAAILAGGQSRRMGTDKRKLPLGGKTLQELAAEKLSLFSERYFSVADDIDQPLPGFVNILDQATECGPLSGMVSVMEKTEAEWVIFIPCDMPMVPQKLLEFILSYRSMENDALILTGNGRAFPVLSAFRRAAALPIMRKAIQEKRLTLFRLIEKELLPLYIPAERFPGFKPIMLQNINTPEDYNHILSASDLIWRQCTKFSNR